MKKRKLIITDKRGRRRVATAAEERALTALEVEKSYAASCARALNAARNELRTTSRGIDITELLIEKAFAALAPHLRPHAERLFQMAENSRPRPFIDFKAELSPNAMVYRRHTLHIPEINLNYDEGM